MNNPTFSLDHNFDIAKIFQASDNNSIFKVLKKGQYLYLQEEIANKIFFIQSGKVKIGTYSKRSRELTKAMLGEGQIFGESCLIGETTRNDFAVAQEETIVYVLQKHTLQDLMRTNTELNAFMMKLIGNRLLKTERRLELLVFKDARERILEYLKELAREFGQPIGLETLVRNFLTHQEIANITSTSRQTVTSTLNDLRKSNIIYFNRKKLLIRDLSKLV